MFVDISWALAHNGGPIFNKGMFFSHPSNPDLYKVLDVQRAGLMPGFVLQYGSPKGHDQELTDLANWICNRFEDAPTVDWDAVQKAGAVGGYHVPGAGTATKKPSTGFKPTPIKPKPVSEAAGVLNTVEFWPKQYVHAVTREQAKILSAKATPVGVKA
jgi:hypothetical protein